MTNVDVYVYDTMLIDQKAYFLILNILRRL